MTVLTYIIGIATDMRRRARHTSFVVAPDVWDRVVAESPQQMRKGVESDVEISLHTPAGAVIVRRGERVCPGCVETWERQSVAPAPPGRTQPLVDKTRLVETVSTLVARGHSPAAALDIAESLCFGVPIDDE